jgi:hypothetical protein
LPVIIRVSGGLEHIALADACGGRFASAGISLGPPMKDPAPLDFCLPSRNCAQRAPSSAKEFHACDPCRRAGHFMRVQMSEPGPRLRAKALSKAAFVTA